jgi:hypothetical protein
MLLATVAVMLGAIHRIPLRVPEDENEGWNAYYALTAMSGGLLYPQTNSFLINNYPPLSFLLVGLLGKALGDYIVAGRVIALASELLVALNIYWLVRLFRGGYFVSLFAAGLFLLYIGTNITYSVAMDDPEWLGHALTTSAAVVYLRATDRPPPIASVLIASLLSVAGVFVKHSVIVLPAVIFLWSVWYARGRLVLWTTASLALGIGALAMTLHAYGLVFLQDLLEHKRVFSSGKAVHDARLLLAPLAPLMVYAGVLALLSWRERAVQFVLLYAAVAAIFGMFCLSGAGVDANVLFDLIIALCVSAGLLAARTARFCAPDYQDLAPALVAVVITTVCLPASLRALERSRLWVQEDHRELEHYQKLIALIAAAPGPVACEQPSLCYWAAKPFELDFFNYGQKILTGTVDATSLRERIDRQEFAYLETIGSPGKTNSYTAKLLGGELSRRITARYSVVHQVGEDFLLAPRR